MSWNATVDRLRARAQHDDLATDEYTRRLLYQAVDEITRLATDRIGGPTTVVRELEIENRRLRVEVQRLTASLKESDDERVSLKTQYPRLRAELERYRVMLDVSEEQRAERERALGPEIERLERRVPNPDDLLLVLDSAYTGALGCLPSGFAATHNAIARVRATMEES